MMPPATMAIIEQALASDRHMTPRQIEALLPVDYSRGTVRAALQALVREGRAEAEGDVNQMRYRRKGGPA